MSDVYPSEQGWCSRLTEHEVLGNEGSLETFRGLYERVGARGNLPRSTTGGRSTLRVTVTVDLLNSLPTPP